MRNYVQEGSVLTFAAPYAVSSGDGFLVGSAFAVATADAANGGTVEGKTDGVVALKKVSTEAWTVGQVIYWDNTAKNATSTATSNTKIGYCTVAAANPSATGRVRLNGTV